MNITTRMDTHARTHTIYIYIYITLKDNTSGSLMIIQVYLQYVPGKMLGKGKAILLTGSEGP
jgi:hypothetical protein